MFKEITVRRISAGSLFKLAGLGLVLTLVPFTTFMGVFALFGAHTVNWNGQAITGVAGLVSSPFIGLFIAGCFTLLLGGCMALGLWLYSLFRPITVLAKIGDASDNA